MGPAEATMATPKPRRKRPPINWPILALLIVVPWMMVPTRMKVAPIAMPTLRPKESIAGPMNGMATTLPIWYMEVTIPAQIPTSGTLKKFLNWGISRSELNIEPSNPLAVEQKNPMRQEKYKMRAAPLK